MRYTMEINWGYNTSTYRDSDDIQELQHSRDNVLRECPKVKVYISDNRITTELEKRKRVAYI